MDTIKLVDYNVFSNICNHQWLSKRAILVENNVNTMNKLNGEVISLQLSIFQRNFSILWTYIVCSPHNLKVRIGALCNLNKPLTKNLLEATLLYRSFKGHHILLLKLLAIFAYSPT